MQVQHLLVFYSVELNGYVKFHQREALISPVTNYSSFIDTEEAILLSGGCEKCAKDDALLKFSASRRRLPSMNCHSSRALSLPVEHRSVRIRPFPRRSARQGLNVVMASLFRASIPSGSRGWAMPRSPSSLRMALVAGEDDSAFAIKKPSKRGIARHCSSYSRGSFPHAHFHGPIRSSSIAHENIIRGGADRNAGRFGPLQGRQQSKGPSGRRSLEQ